MTSKASHSSYATLTVSLAAVLFSVAALLGAIDATARAAAAGEPSRATIADEWPFELTVGGHFERPGVRLWLHSVKMDRLGRADEDLAVIYFQIGPHSSRATLDANEPFRVGPAVVRIDRIESDGPSEGGNGRITGVLRMERKQGDPPPPPVPREVRRRLELPGRLVYAGTVIVFLETSRASMAEGEPGTRARFFLTFGNSQKLVSVVEGERYRFGGLEIEVTRLVAYDRSTPAGEGVQADIVDLVIRAVNAGDARNHE